MEKIILWSTPEIEALVAVGNGGRWVSIVDYCSCNREVLSTLQRLVVFLDDYPNSNL